ncbi:MAG TPA: hypothetical protein VMM92_15805 [Thermoanaerobaculia bacterium]|nr:hypothetical protein [Thermoanaerobaculia bacterium]
MTLPLFRFLSRLHRPRGRLGAPERELLAACALALGLASAALYWRPPHPLPISPSDLLLAALVLGSVCGLLALGRSVRKPGPDDPTRPPAA